MPQISTNRLVEAAILPSFFIIASKTLGLFVGSLLFSIPWSFNFSPAANNFLIFQYPGPTELSTVINFSDIVTVLTTGIGFTWIVFQAHHLNVDKTHPTLISKIYRKGRDFWLTTTGQIHHAAAVWLGLSWLVLFLVLINVYHGLTSEFVLGVALALTLGLTIAFYGFVKAS
jgi:hypothetical protein